MSTETLDRPARAAQSAAGKYLTFALGREEYGLQILKVREIIGFMDITAVPQTPAYVRGVINLRGQVISVVDLRAKFGMPAADRTDQTCIIVVEIRQPGTGGGGQGGAGGRKLSTGIVVDRVSEVLSIAADAIEEPPAFGTGVSTDFIVGMAKAGHGVKILLDIDRVLGGDGADALARLAA